MGCVRPILILIKKRDLSVQAQVCNFKTTNSTLSSAQELKKQNSTSSLVCEKKEETKKVGKEEKKNAIKHAASFVLT